MADHRIRLTDADVALITAALNARLAMTRGMRAHRICRLRDRLREMTPGNPQFSLGAHNQTHEEELDDLEE